MATDDALPEGLVERCIDASYYPEHPEWKCDDPIIRAEWRKLVVSVLAVAAPALKEQALREIAERTVQEIKAPFPRSKVRDLETENSRLNAELMRERSRRDAPR